MKRSKSYEPESDRSDDRIERAKALLFAYEKVFLDLNVEPECQELAGMAISTFYAI